MRIIYPTPIRKCRSLRISEALERVWLLSATLLCLGVFITAVRAIPYLAVINGVGL